MVGTRHPHRIETAHAVIPREAVHDGLIERMAHVQRSGDVGRRQLNCEAIGIITRFAGASVPRCGVRALFPLRAPLRFNGRRFERFGQLLQAGLLGFDGVGGRGGGHRWSQSEPPILTGSGSTSRRRSASICGFSGGDTRGQQGGVANLICHDQDQLGIE